MTLQNRLTILQYAAASGIADYGQMYTWKTWLAGWMSRVLCQVAFFATLGLLFDSAGTAQFLAVGNAVGIVVVECCFVTASTTWERQSGTLPLLIAAPVSPLLAFGGRSVFWLATGTLTATVSLFTISPLFGLHPAWPRSLLVIPFITAIGFSTYCLALVLSAFVLRRMELRNITGNLANLTLMVLCGAQVPVTFWPAPIQALTDFLPLKHGLSAIRSILSGEDRPIPLLHAALLEIAVGTGWLIIAALVFRRFIEGGRKDGSIEFGG